jgi:hypothetical protein
VLIAASQTLARDHLVHLEEERRFQETLELNRCIRVLATSAASAPLTENPKIRPVIS